MCCCLVPNLYPLPALPAIPSLGDIYGHRARLASRHHLSVYPERPAGPRLDTSAEPNFVIRFILVILCVWGAETTMVQAQSKHSLSSRFNAYQGMVMCGYQGWFRAEGDGSGEGWVHYGTQGRLDESHVHVDLWPEVSEYPQTYPTGLTNRDGSVARVFSSWDASTTDLHFSWMEHYGIDGVFIQRFFGATRTPTSRHASRVILSNALAASQKHGRAIAVMYDLSGLKANGEDCSSIIEDWKELVDELKITSQGTNQTYLYNHGKPLVAIWGLGFPDRPYNIRNIGIEKLIDFLKHDPVYGGCAVMLGVPTYFRDLNVDCLPDPYLHEVMAKADIIMPWRVQRFTPLLHSGKWRAMQPRSRRISPGAMPGIWNMPPAFIQVSAGIT